MKRFNFISFCAILISLLLISCKESVDVEKVKKEIEEANSIQLKAFKTKDLDGMIINYADDAVILPQNGPLVSGRDNIETFFKQMSSMMNDFSFSMTDFDASGDLAYEVGSYIGFFTSVTDTGKYVTIWKRQADGKYMIVADIFNTSITLPTSEMHETMKK